VHIFDVVTLLLATTAALKFWWASLGIQDLGLLGVAAFASIAEALRRVAIARRHWQRPSTFFSDRRSDLLIAILLASGPRPILPSFAPSLMAPSFSVPVWVRLLVLTGVVVLATRRLLAAVDFGSKRHVHETAIRQLIAVPDAHIASMFLLPTCGPQEVRAAGFPTQF